jgi:hypothetical protein
LLRLRQGLLEAPFRRKEELPHAEEQVYSRRRCLCLMVVQAGKFGVEL